jgi:hypothetical protein
MDNAKKLSPIFQASVRFAITQWWLSVEKSGFGTGLTTEDVTAILGGSPKQNGTALGKDSFPSTGRRLSNMPKPVRNTSQT